MCIFILCYSFPKEDRMKLIALAFAVVAAVVASSENYPTFKSSRPSEAKLKQRVYGYFGTLTNLQFSKSREYLAQLPLAAQPEPSYSLKLSEIYKEKGTIVLDNLSELRTYSEENGIWVGEVAVVVKVFSGGVLFMVVEMETYWVWEKQKEIEDWYFLAATSVKEIAQLKPR